MNCTSAVCIIPMLPAHVWADCPGVTVSSHPTSSAGLSPNRRVAPLVGGRYQGHRCCRGRALFAMVPCITAARRLLSPRPPRFAPLAPTRRVVAASASARRPRAESREVSPSKGTGCRAIHPARHSLGDVGEGDGKNAGRGANTMAGLANTGVTPVNCAVTICSKAPNKPIAVLARDKHCPMQPRAAGVCSTSPGAAAWSPLLASALQCSHPTPAHASPSHRPTPVLPQ
jgi:hypothetical protein